MSLINANQKRFTYCMFAFLLSVFLVFFYLILPVYEGEDNSFRNTVEGGNKYWHDGLSPLMFTHFDNYLRNRDIEVLGNVTPDKYKKLNISDYVDEICVNNKCYPLFYTTGLHVFFEFSSWIRKIFQFESLQYLLIINSLVYASSVIVLFFILNKIEKNKPLLAFLVSLTIGLGTSFVIYPKYLFLHNSFQILTFVLFLYSFILFEERKNEWRFLIFTVTSILFVISWQALASIVIATFLSFWFFVFNHRKVRTEFNLIYVFILSIVALVEFKIFLNFLSISTKAEKPIFGGNSLLYNIYNGPLYATDFVSVSLFYSTIRSNALFLKLYPIFSYFFGARGIFVNSPFLLFSLVGIVTFDKKRLKLHLLTFLLFFILAFAYFHTNYEGGFFPRYVRHSEPIIVILSIFLTDFLKKLKNKKILLIFIPFVIISVTNSISLAIRTDWSYEKITDLVSYDIVLWPWLPTNLGDITLDLTKISEGSKWNLKWDEGCNPPITEPRLSIFGLELGPCECTFNNNASRSIRFPREFKYLKIEACSYLAGGDGAILEIFIDNKGYSYFINSQKCEDIILNISDFADDNVHIITLSAKRNGVCSYEVISVKKLVFLKYAEIIKQENLIKNPLIWKVYSPCDIYWLNDSIVSDKCYCTSYSYAYTQLKFKRDQPFLNLEVCADEAGNDGVIAKIIANDNTYSFFVPSNTCVKRSIFLNFEDGREIKLNLTSETYGYCNRERIFWRSIKFENKSDGILEEQKEIYDLRSKDEQKNWKLRFSEVCNPPLTEPRFSELGIETGPCACSFINNASRMLKIPKEFNALKIDVCSRLGGGDGISTYIYIDNEVAKRATIDSSSCESLIVDISKFADDKDHIITLESRRHGACREEVAIWKKMELLKWNHSFPIYQFDLLDNIEKWESANVACQPVFMPIEMVTDVCDCLQEAKAVYYFRTEKDEWINLKILGCADFAGGDGVIGEISIDGNTTEMFIKSNSCNYFERKIKLTRGNHTLYLQPKIYGDCSAEWIKWKEVVIEE